MFYNYTMFLLVFIMESIVMAEILNLGSDPEQQREAHLCRKLDICVTVLRTRYKNTSYLYNLSILMTVTYAFLEENSEF